MDAIEAGQIGAVAGAEGAFDVCAKQADKMAAEAAARGASEGSLYLTAFANTIRSVSAKWVADFRSREP